MAKDYNIDDILLEVKKRKDSIADFEKAQRQDLIDQINDEIAALEVYLPKQLTDDELETKIKAIIEKVDAKDIKDLGKVMKEAKTEIGAQADGRRINETVRKLLS